MFTPEKCYRSKQIFPRTEYRWVAQQIFCSCPESDSRHNCIMINFIIRENFFTFLRLSFVYLWNSFVSDRFLLFLLCPIFLNEYLTKHKFDGSVKMFIWRILRLCDVKHDLRQSLQRHFILRYRPYISFCLNLNDKKVWSDLECSARIIHEMIWTVTFDPRESINLFSNEA